MRLPEIIEAITRSSRCDWFVIGCWGGGTGPSYRDQLTFNRIHDGQPNVITIEQHSNSGTLIENASITMTWGLQTGAYQRPWLERFRHANSAINALIDVFYNGALVFRTQYVVVDEGRALLPAPEGEELRVPENYRSFVKLVHILVHGSHAGEEFDTYYRQAGFQSDKSPWPVFDEMN